MSRFAAYCALVEQHIEQRYRIRVVTRDIPDPLLGDLDGAEIHIDHALTDEQRLFLLAHLFGHTVQWNTNPRSLEIGRPQTPPVPESLMPEILDYERQAAGYALSMLHEAGVRDLDQWISDYSAADVAYLSHFYRTGEKAEFEQFRTGGAEPLTPAAIPPFVPSRHALRADGIVI